MLKRASFQRVAYERVQKKSDYGHSPQLVFVKYEYHGKLMEVEMKQKDKIENCTINMVLGLLWNGKAETSLKAGTTWFGS